MMMSNAYYLKSKQAPWHVVAYSCCGVEALGTFNTNLYEVVAGEPPDTLPWGMNQPPALPILSSELLAQASPRYRLQWLMAQLWQTFSDSPSSVQLQYIQELTQMETLLRLERADLALALLEAITPPSQEATTLKTTLLDIFNQLP
jgi:hypothetical protein